MRKEGQTGGGANSRFSQSCRRLKTDLLETLKHQVIYDLHVEVFAGDEDCNEKQRILF
jgi:hypothetical protein